jgi:hypothetical protein
MRSVNCYRDLPPERIARTTGPDPNKAVLFAMKKMAHSLGVLNPPALEQIA